MACWSAIEGTYRYQELLGSKFKLKSVPLSLHGNLQTGCPGNITTETMTLAEVYFKATTDGKVYPMFRMKEVCGRLFSPRDLELIETTKIPKLSAVCGNIVCGNVRVGSIGKNDLGESDVYDDPGISEIITPW